MRDPGSEVNFIIGTKNEPTYFLMFIYLFLRESEWEGAERKVDRESQTSPALSAQRAMGLELTNHEIMT